MPVNLSALRSELLSDPSGIGYSTALLRGDDNALVDLLNTVGVGTVSVGTVFAISMQQCVVVSEYSNLTATQRDLWNVLITTGVNGIAISNVTIRNQIAGVWGAGTTTRTNLLALVTRSAARSEVLFGEGVYVTANDCNKARNP